MNTSNAMEGKRIVSFILYLSLAIAAVLLPLSYVHATSIGTNVTVTGNTTIGDATSDTLTVTARLAATLNPNANNTIDLGSYDLAFKDVYVSSTVFVGDISDLIYIDANNARVGISSSTPSALLSVGSSAAVTSTLGFGTACFRMSAQIGDTESQVYYWPCVGTACPNVLSAATGWATSTASCF